MLTNSPIQYGYKKVVHTSFNNNIHHAKFVGSSKSRKKPVAKVARVVGSCCVCKKPIYTSTTEDKQRCECFDVYFPFASKKRLTELFTSTTFLNRISHRTKQKIESKIYSWFAARKKGTTFTFLTLTFINLVTDEQATKILNNFFTTVRKRTKQDFQYLWVVERQSANFKYANNPHFHIINNVYWDIDLYNRLWIEAQHQAGVINDKVGLYNPFEIDGTTGKYYPQKLNPFDVSKVYKSSSFYSLGAYITKYITKNKKIDAGFTCQTWNCSRWVSNLATSVRNSIDYYTSACASALNYYLSKTDHETGEQVEKPTFKVHAKIQNIELDNWKGMENAKKIIGVWCPVYNIRLFYTPLKDLESCNRDILSMSKEQLKSLTIPSMYRYDGLFI